jgi:predicted enzyme related to lactoylglutathione lyase
MDHWVVVWPKGATWKLHLCEGELEPGNTGIGFYTDNVEKVVASLKKKGVAFSQDYTKTEWGEIAKFDDPDGNVFWISKGSA